MIAMHFLQASVGWIRGLIAGQLGLAADAKPPEDGAATTLPLAPPDLDVAPSVKG